MAELSVVSCQLPVVSCQLSVVSCQLPVVSCQLLGGRDGRSKITFTHYPLPITHYPLPITQDYWFLLAELLQCFLLLNQVLL
jgi:hypothetical protein